MFKYKKILVIGCPGSGKSYFSNELSKITNIPCIHIDNLYWSKDKTHISRQELVEKYQDVLKLDQFILDGNYISTLEYRLNYVDFVFFLNLPFDVCKKSIYQRIGTIRDDIPWVETKEDAEELISLNENFKESKEYFIYVLLRKNPNVHYQIFKTREEVNEFLVNLKKDS